ncbi:MAG TPA: crosslink repair DNA glycosylase YcaQ family protein, partial [Candidatus Limnocylindria bacterium]
WDGARAPTLWTVPPPRMRPAEARLELARRYLHAFGPATPDSFATWAGIGQADGPATFADLAGELVPVVTPIGPAWILASDEADVRRAPQPARGARLLPSGDTYFLLWGADRELLLPDPDQRAALWTSRVWPGAVLLDGRIVGTWRRAGHVVTATPWQPLAAADRVSVEEEAAALPLPGLAKAIGVRWEG